MGVLHTVAVSALRIAKGSVQTVGLAARVASECGAAKAAACSAELLGTALTLPPVKARDEAVKLAHQIQNNGKTALNHTSRFDPSTGTVVS